jgi:hypothetical protein
MILPCRVGCPWAYHHRLNHPGVRRTGVSYLTPAAAQPRALPQDAIFVGASVDIHFLHSQGFDHDGLDLHWSPEAFSPFGLLTLVLCPQWPCPLELTFAVLDTPGTVLSQIRSSWCQEDLNCPGEVLTHTLGETTFGD